MSAARKAVAGPASAGRRGRPKPAPQATAHAADGRDVPPAAGPGLRALAAMRCRPGAARLDAEALAGHLRDLPGWVLGADGIAKSFRFAGWQETIAFVNAVAWIAHRDDHHPDLVVGYDRCRVAWSTHDAAGVTLNDCICAAGVECLVA